MYGNMGGRVEKYSEVVNPIKMIINPLSFTARPMLT